MIDLAERMAALADQARPAVTLLALPDAAEARRRHWRRRWSYAAIGLVGRPRIPRYQRASDNEVIPADREADGICRRPGLIPGEQLPSSPIDFHRRPQRIPRGLMIGAAAGVVATTAVVVSLLVVGGTSSAFAQWKATPTIPSAGQLATAKASCRAQLAAHAPAADFVEGRGSSPTLTDVRGPYTVALYARALYPRGSSFVACFTGPSFTDLLGNSLTPPTQASRPGGPLQQFVSIGRVSGACPVPKAPPPTIPPRRVPALGPDGFDIFAMSIFRLSNGCPYVFVVGHVQDPLTAAVVERSSGSHVTATTADGYFEAWWPGTALATSVLLTSAGVTTPSGSTALTHGHLPGA